MKLKKPCNGELIPEIAWQTSDAVESAQATARTTVVMVKDHSVFRGLLSGGRGASGMGMAGIQPSMRQMTRQKMLAIKGEVL